MNRICKKCGNQLKDTSKFCSKCGTPYVDEPNTQGAVNPSINVQPKAVTPPVQPQASSNSSNQDSGSKGCLYKLVKWVVILGIVLFAFSALCGKGSDEKKAVNSSSNTVTDVATIDKMFLGKWKHYNPNYPKDPSSLTIKKDDSKTGGYEVEIFFYRIADVKGYANIDGNKLSINQGKINDSFNFRGTIEKTNNGIRLNITESGFQHVKPGQVYEYIK